MDIESFFYDVLSKSEDKIKKYFHKNAYINWHCSNEKFTVNEYIQANCEYPGNWKGQIDRIEKFDNLIIFVGRVFSEDEVASFHVVSFISLKDDLIIEMDEYWSDDGLAPKWRIDMNIGNPIN